MKNKDMLLDAIGDVDGALVPDAARPKSRRRITRRVAFGSVCAAVIACAVCLPILFRQPPAVIPTPQEPSQPQTEMSSASEAQPQATEANRPIAGSAKLLTAAVYPPASAYPQDGSGEEWDYEAYEAWSDERLAKIRQAENYRDSFTEFVRNSAGVFFGDSDEQNRVYSPLSLYMALGMSAEVTGGSTRQQILGALSQENIDALRTEAKNLWEACYADDGMAKCVLASSLWTNDRMRYRQDTLDTLSSAYYASAFSGDPTDERYSLSLQSWLNEQTDGLLADYASDIRMNPQMMLTLASTVDYSGKWEYPFNEDSTRPAVFHAPTGDVSCDFMNAEQLTGYCWGERFAAISMPLENNGSMRLLLPDEGVSPQELLRDEEALRFMSCKMIDDFENCRYASVTIKVPKFDISSGIDLREGLQQLGVTEMFDGAAADFSPLCDDADGIFVDKAEQDTRVMIDEDGCKAASMTVMMSAGAAPPKEFVDFIVDRPFVFEIVSESGIPLFVGVVNHPAA